MTCSCPVPLTNDELGSYCPNCGKGAVYAPEHGPDAMVVHLRAWPAQVVAATQTEEPAAEEQCSDCGAVILGYHRCEAPYQQPETD